MTPDGPFGLPAVAPADRPPEARGLPRDGVRLLVSQGATDAHRRFDELPELLRPGDLLIVNESATLPASLEAVGRSGRFLLNLSTSYGENLWLAESRWSESRPGPVPIAPSETIRLGGLAARWVAPYPGIERLAFFRLRGDVGTAMQRYGRPIRYAYLRAEVPLREYQTVFARVPGSAEMPSAARPFTPTLVDRLRRRGVRIAPILLHTGVSSLETDPAGRASPPIYPEPFEVPPATVDAIDHVRERGGRVIAVGTTVVRALESVVGPCGLRPGRGFTRLYLHPGRPPRSFDGLLTGLHDARSTHLALLAWFAGEPRLLRAYRAAIEEGYLWHEFGDSHLILPGEARAGRFAG